MIINIGKYRIMFYRYWSLSYYDYRESKVLDSIVRQWVNIGPINIAW